MKKLHMTPRVLGIILCALTQTSIHASSTLLKSQDQYRAATSHAYTQQVVKELEDADTKETPFHAWMRNTYSTFTDKAASVPIKGYANYTHVGGGYDLSSKIRLGAYATAIQDHTRHNQTVSTQVLDIRTRGHDYGVTPYLNYQYDAYLSFFASLSYFEGKTRMDRTILDVNRPAGATPVLGIADYRSRRITSSLFAYFLLPLAKNIYTQFEVGHFQTSDQSKAFSITTTSGVAPVFNRTRSETIGDLVGTGKIYYTQFKTVMPYLELGMDMYTNNVRYFDVDDRSYKRNPFGYIYGIGLRIQSFKKKMGGGVSIRQRRGHTKLCSNDLSIDFNIKF